MNPLPERRERVPARAKPRQAAHDEIITKYDIVSAVSKFAGNGKAAR